jgi:aminomethyltransferase
MNSLKQTPLHSIHKSMGAKMLPFGGWDMPIQYAGIVQEHTTTREAVGLFDVSHMGEIFIEGSQELIIPFLEKTTCNLISNLKDKQVQYNAVLNERGGLVDDITIYKFNDSKFMICANASNFEKVYDHLIKLNPPSGIKVTNRSSEYHQLALQGPKANALMEKVLGKDLSYIKYYHFDSISWRNEEIILSRTGYTGEDGFEIYTSNTLGVSLWSELLELGKEFGICPVGLGARDTLRIEAKYPLYGHELNQEWTPVESGIGWIVKEKQIPYFQYDKIIQEKKQGSAYNIVPILLKEPGVMREQMKVYSKDGEEIGVLTSGTHSPSLKTSIGLARIKKGFQEDGCDIIVDIRGQKKSAVVHKKPFIPGSVRK